MTWAQIDTELHEGGVEVCHPSHRRLREGAFDCKDHEAEERNLIAVGGDKFSRRFTLEGLSIIPSYNHQSCLRQIEGIDRA